MGVQCTCMRVHGSNVLQHVSRDLLGCMHILQLQAFMHGWHACPCAGKEVVHGLMVEGADVVIAARNMDACELVRSDVEARGSCRARR